MTYKPKHKILKLSKWALMILIKFYSLKKVALKDHNKMSKKILQKYHFKIYQSKYENEPCMLPYKSLHIAK